MLGDRLSRERTGKRDVKGLVMLVAEAGDWNGASCLADALGVPPDVQEQWYAEAYSTTSNGGATPTPHHHRRKQPA
jgi:hypothetical protein